MSTKSTRSTKHSMSRRLVRLVAGATLGVSALTIATPAMAMNKPEPAGGCVDWTPVTPDKVADSFDVSEAGLGALGGIALGGIGLGIGLVVLRRRDNTTSDQS
ncbi:hypothetical protein ACQPYH_31365 [Kribbella sp. CA-245084]|uniref:hypothetical protein n=1 Tax=Kribbella sp. CA-245084 TaxID=3239940 RepID=UPI003D8CCAE7